MHNKDSGEKKKNKHKCLIWKDVTDSRIEKRRPSERSLNAAEIKIENAEQEKNTINAVIQWFANMAHRKRESCELD